MSLGNRFTARCQTSIPRLRLSRRWHKADNFLFRSKYLEYFGAAIRDILLVLNAHNRKNLPRPLDLLRPRFG